MPLTVEELNARKAPFSNQTVRFATAGYDRLGAPRFILDEAGALAGPALDIGTGVGITARAIAGRGVSHRRPGTRAADSLHSRGCRQVARSVRSLWMRRGDRRPARPGRRRPGVGGTAARRQTGRPRRPRRSLRRGPRDGLWGVHGRGAANHGGLRNPVRRRPRRPPQASPLARWSSRPSPARWITESP
jgi:hypothetical protein